MKVLGVLKRLFNLNSNHTPKLEKIYKKTRNQDITGKIRKMTAMGGNRKENMLLQLNRELLRLWE